MLVDAPRPGGVKRREGVIGHFRRARNGPDQRGFAGIGHPKESHVGKHLELELQRQRSPGLAGVNCRGARLVLDLKCRLPSPPRRLWPVTAVC